MDNYSKKDPAYKVEEMQNKAGFKTIITYDGDMANIKVEGTPYEISKWLRTEDNLPDRFILRWGKVTVRLDTIGERIAFYLGLDAALNWAYKEAGKSMFEGLKEE